MLANILEEDGHLKGFCFLTISNDTQNPMKCIKLLNKTKWKNCVLTLEQAKIDYKEKLQKEKEAEIERQKTINATATEMPIGTITSFKIHVFILFYFIFRENVYFPIKLSTNTSMKMEIS